MCYQSPKTIGFLDSRNISCAVENKGLIKSIGKGDDYDK